MAIRRQLTRDPLAGPPGRRTPVNLPSDERVILASSAAGRELRAHVESYCKRHINGRSILLGGSRGAGKTTLTAYIAEILRASGRLSQYSQPLIVPIHGPDFFDGGSPSKTNTHESSEPAKTTVIVNYPGTTPGPPAAPTPPSTEPNAPDDREAARFALRVLTIGLYRAFVTDISWALQLQAAGKPELHELIAQLRLDLDEEVDLAALRSAWQSLGALEAGVLERGNAFAMADYGTSQGLLEIIATRSLIEGYIRILGKVEYVKQDVFESALKQEVDGERSQKLLNSIAGALSGGAAGTGIFLQSGLSGGAKALLGTLAIPIGAFLTTVLLNTATSKSRSMKNSEDRKIAFDKSLESLDLIFPLLVNRALDAGRAPLFIVDELDKVKETEKKLDALIPRLKHIVSDKAFFCFLVNRSSYDKIQRRVQRNPRSKVSTFFSRRLFVNYTAQEWRDYLVGSAPAGQSLIKHLSERNYADQFLEPSLLMSDAAPQSPERNDDARTLFQLSYYLLARSRMHAADLQRAIDSWPRQQDAFIPDNFDRPHFRNLITYQAIVEAVMRTPELATRVENDPDFRQRLYDTLYDPLQSWSQGATEFV